MTRQALSTSQPQRALAAVCLLNWFVFSCAVLAPQAARADVPEVYRGRTIVGVELAGEGAALTDPDELAIPTGVPLTRALLRDVVQRLLDGGRWVDVQVDALPAEGGVRLRLWLEPRLVVSRIQLTGNAQLEDAELFDVLGVRENATITKDELSAIGTRLRRLYAEQGYLSTSVSISFRDTENPARKVLMVEIVEGAPTRIRSLRFTGEKPPNAAPVLTAMGLSTGDQLDRKQLENQAEQGAAYLRRRGYYEAQCRNPLVTVRGDLAEVELPCHVGPHYTLRVSGFAPLEHSDVVDAMALTEEPLVRTRLRQGLPDAIRDVYARRGFTDTRVDVLRLRGKRPDTAVLRVKIEPGQRLEVVAVSFIGARHFSRAFLRDQLFSYLEEDLPGTGLLGTVDAEVADEMLYGQPRDYKRGTLRPLSKTPRETYYEATYEEAIEHIRELYRSEGFLGVQIGAPRLRRVGKRRAAVSIPVTEGPRTYLHSVRIIGNEIMSSRDLLIAAGLTRHQPFSYLALEEARLRITAAYQERGFMFEKTDPQLRFSGDRTRAEVTFEVVERFPVHIGEVVISGAERTDERYIRRVLSLSEGDLFRPSLARKSEQDLQALGVFGGVNVALDEPELAARVKRLVVDVSERKSQYLNFTAGLSTGQGIRGGFEYGYRNLFGQAMDLSLRVQLAHQLFFVDRELGNRFKRLTSLNQRIERRISLGFVIPRTLGLSSVRTAVDLVHLRDNERDFGLDKNGVGVTFTYLPLRLVTTTLGADLENNNVQLFVEKDLDEFLANTSDLRLRRLLRVPAGDSTLVALRASASYDKRDSPFTPTRGFFASLNGEIARTLTSETIRKDAFVSQFDSQFLKLALTVSTYLPVGKEVVLATQGRIGRIFHFTETSRTYPNRAFFLGGVDTMRGYLQDAMVPQDLATKVFLDPSLTSGSIVRAGDAFVLLRSEVRFPLYDQLRGGVFLDMGNLWAEAENLWPFALRQSVGAGLRLSTPVGPVAIDYGILLRRRTPLREPFGTLHFSIGLF